jgi:hypothetical protein
VHELALAKNRQHERELAKEAQFVQGIKMAWEARILLIQGQTLQRLGVFLHLGPEGVQECLQLWGWFKKLEACQFGEVPGEVDEVSDALEAVDGAKLKVAVAEWEQRRIKMLDKIYWERVLPCSSWCGELADWCALQDELSAIDVKLLGAGMVTARTQIRTTGKKQCWQKFGAAWICLPSWVRRRRTKELCLRPFTTMYKSCILGRATEAWSRILEAEAEAEAEAKAEAKAKAEAEVEAEAEVKVEAEAEVKVKVEAEAEAEVL